MAEDETTSDKMEIHWCDDDGRMAMIFAERLRPHRRSVERILAMRNAITEPMDIPTLRPSPLRIAAIVLLFGVVIACVAALLR